MPSSPYWQRALSSVYGLDPQDENPPKPPSPTIGNAENMAYDSGDYQTGMQARMLRKGNLPQSDIDTYYGLVASDPRRSLKSINQRRPR